MPANMWLFRGNDKDGPKMSPNIRYYPQSRSPATRRPMSGTSPSQSPSRDAPPPYTPRADPVSSPTAQSVLSTPSIPTTSTAAATDDRYSFLSTFDTVFLIDDSGSMAGGLWRQTSDALETITPICTAHDADGVDLYFLNAPHDASKHRNIRDPAGVREAFRSVTPRGGTPTGQRLSDLLRPYVAQYTADKDGTKPLNIICVTDGAASDDVESSIIWAARALDRLDAPAWQVGIQFFQVGHDPEATRDLAMLDDELASHTGRDAIRDIVDTVPFTGAAGERLTGEGILKVVLGAVNRRLDRRQTSGLHS